VISLFVTNFPYSVEESDLHALFGQYGEVKRVKILTDRITGKSRGCGFIDMADREAGLNAIADLNGGDWGGRELKLREAEDRPRPTNPNPRALGRPA
jgi:cold-inducible RNA-binding protein